MEELAAANSSSIKTARETHERDYENEIKRLEAKERDLLVQFRKLDEAKQAVAQAAGDITATGDDLVEINAGGKVIATTRSTLTQFKGTKLEALFSGRWDKKITKDNLGRIFLDINPICFQAIVDYLNDVKILNDDNPAAPPSVDPEYQNILHHQLDLFGLSDELFPIELPDSNIIRKHNDVSLLYEWLDEDNLPIELPDSNIIRKHKDASLLYEWLDEDNSGGDLTLLYRSSSDGRNEITFHSKCDNKGPTLTIVETNEGHIVGGYSDVDWRGYCYSHSDKAFLFAISTTASYPPSKMKLLKGSDKQYAICKHPSYGPTFGGRHDLYVQKTLLQLNIGHTYASPPDQLKPASDGYLYLNIKELEVIQVVPGSSSIQRPNQAIKKQTDKTDTAAANKPAPNNQVQSFSAAVNSAINQKWATLEKAELEIADMEVSFKKEESFVSFFSNEKDDVILLNVSGTPMATTRTTMELSGKSVLASTILGQSQGCKKSNAKPVKEWSTQDVVAWLNRFNGLSPSVIKNFEEDEVTGCELLALGKEGLMHFGVTKGGTLFYVLSEIKKLESTQGGEAMLIEHSPYCIEKIIDHLRLENMFIKRLIEQKPELPVVRTSEKARFEKVVKHFFPGDSSKSFLCN